MQAVQAAGKMDADGVPLIHCGRHLLSLAQGIYLECCAVRCKRRAVINFMYYDNRITMKCVIVLVQGTDFMGRFLFYMGV